MDQVDHDRLFKDLLTTFFAEFLELFLPKVAEELDRGSIHFLDKEIFSELDTGDRHEVDLLAKVKLSGAEAFILIHVENQATAQAEFPRRMFQYFWLLTAKFNLPVFPIALFSYDSPLVPAVDRYELNLFGHPILQFQFHAIQLNRLNWRDFLSRPNPVANALMTKMKIAPGDRPRVKAECLRMMATLKLDLARSDRIAVFMNSYLVLTVAENAVYTKETEKFDVHDKEFVMRYMNEWEEKGLEQGAIKGRIELLFRQLRRRFGTLPSDITDNVNHLTADQLDALAEALLDFNSLTDAQDWLARIPLPATGNN